MRWCARRPSQQRLQLGKEHLDRVEVGRVRRQVEQDRASRGDRIAHPATLWAGRLSIMTMLPRDKQRRDQAALDIGAEDLIARSMTKGAVTASTRNPATKVVVFQCPCGTRPISREPRRQRPRKRAMLVAVPVSSINTSRRGSSCG